MNKINLGKYGFVRKPESDFNDDGNHFKAYMINGILFTYLRSGNRLYLSGRGHTVGVRTLNWEDYSKLPSYKKLNMLNGKDVDMLTEQDFLDLVEVAEKYSEEFNHCFETLPDIPREDILHKLMEIRAKRTAEYNEFCNAFNNCSVKVLSLSNYDLQSLQRTENKLREYSEWSDEVLERSVDTICESKTSKRHFVNSTYIYDMEDSYCYKNSLQILNKLNGV